MKPSAAVVLLLAAAAPLACRAGSRVYPVPDGIAGHAAGYSVLIDGAEAPAVPVRCSAMPVNCLWPGHERDMDQTETCALVRFAFEGSVRVRVDPGRGFREAVVRPLSRKVAVERRGGAVEFTLTEPGGYSVEFDGRRRNLHVFADPWKGPECPSGKGVRRFGPGIHEAGEIVLRTGDVLFLDEGAWVKGFVRAEDADHVRILGRGVIDMGGVGAETRPVDEEERRRAVREVKIVDNARRFNLMSFRFCDDLRVEGVTLIDSMTWNIVLLGCRGVVLDNVKTVGNWRYNADGFDLMNSRDVTIRNCFLRTFDDSIVIKGFSGAFLKENGGYLHDGEPFDCVADVLVTNCVTWCDWGRNLEIGLETCAREMRNIRFTGCDCICSTHVVADVQNGDCADVHDVVFERIGVEYDAFQPAARYGERADCFDPGGRGRPAPLAVCEICYNEVWSLPGERGRIRNVVFRDFDVRGPEEIPEGRLAGHDALHAVEGVVFERIRLNGRDVTDEFSARVSRNAFVK